MGKTNLILLITGLAACIALSLMMGQVVRLKVKHDTPSVVDAITETFGTRLQRQSTFSIWERGTERIGELGLYPHLGASQRNMVKQIGDFAWQETGTEEKLSALIVTIDEGFGDAPRYLVPRPFTTLSGVRELKPDEMRRGSKPDPANLPKPSLIKKSDQKKTLPSDPAPKKPGGSGTGRPEPKPPR